MPYTCANYQRIGCPNLVQLPGDLCAGCTRRCFQLESSQGQQHGTNNAQLHTVWVGCRSHQRRYRVPSTDPNSQYISCPHNDGMDKIQYQIDASPPPSQPAHILFPPGGDYEL